MTADPTQLEALAQRCEQATGREDIAWFDALARDIHEVDPRSNVNGTCKDYPRSVDAALTLVPEGQDYRVHRTANGVRVVVWIEGRFVGFPAEAATPALAITAAALRAHAAKEVA